MEWLNKLKPYFNKILNLYYQSQKYLLNANGQPNILGKIVKTIFVLIIAKMSITAILGFIQGTLKLKRGDKKSLHNRRVNTIGNIIGRAIKALIYFYCALIILEIFNIDTKSILATAGIGGIAIGFGAQSLVKDIISGFFILQDDLYVVGDYIKIKGYEGRVEDLELRITKLRDKSGDLHIIPNGSVDIISNLSRGGIRVLVYAPIAYEEDINRAIDVLDQVCQETNEEFKKYIVSPTLVKGVDRLSDVSIDIRLENMVYANKMEDVRRYMLKRIKEVLEENNIEIPYKKLIVYGGDEIETKL